MSSAVFASVPSDSGKPRVAVLVGSPRKGVTDELARLISAGIRDAGGESVTFDVREHPIAGCTGCGGCLGTGECVIHDDMDLLLDIVDGCDGLIVATPVYFASAPSQLKAVYDRFQPRWARRYVLGQPACPKRPALLAVTGTGGDPFGFEPLVITTRSALNIAGFRLEAVEDFIGFLQADAGALSGDAARAGEATGSDNGCLTARVGNAAGSDDARRAERVGAEFVGSLLKRSIERNRT